MPATSEIAMALLTSLVCFVAAFRIRWARAAWVCFGFIAAGYAVIAAHELSRRDNGLLLSAAIPLIVAPVLALGITRLSRAGLALMMLVATSYAGWSDFVSPVMAESELAALQTRFTASGVCLQTTEYTCGPAAAVTLLRTLGVRAEEGELGLLAHSSPQTGTDPSDLAVALERRFGSAGLRARYEALGSLDALGAACPALTVVNYGEIGHWVAVIAVTDLEVFFADPHDGFHVEKRNEFAQRWLNETVILQR